ncbi:LysM domain protein [Ancylostoma caninum]|uniref:LysM domain protein n=1 Tax=Ancylostoma caninum TaxID=29170 RepID=A0A368GKY1_ANCCA|nr:LysM domain protein [Ancylostoma caninum]
MFHSSWVVAFEMDYTVTVTDSLESIAASHDCTVGELMKLNRMSSRMVCLKNSLPLSVCF